MKKTTLQSLYACLMVLATLFITSCANDIEENSSSAAKTTPRAAIGSGSFSLWQSCTTKPYLYSTGIIVPVGGTECSTNYVGAQQNGGQYASGMSFYGAFKGGSNAPNGSNEMAVFICDNVSTWTGREMGFVKTLNDNALKAYLQSPGGVYIYRTISVGDNGFHTYKCQVNSGDNTKVDFYVDNVYKFTLQNPGVSYKNLWYYFVGTTHRNSGGWSSSGQQVDMYNMTTY
jgi:hypothetical protein